MSAHTPLLQDNVDAPVYEPIGADDIVENGVEVVPQHRHRCRLAMIAVAVIVSFAVLAGLLLVPLCHSSNDRLVNVVIVNYELDPVDIYEADDNSNEVHIARLGPFDRVGGLAFWPNSRVVIRNALTGGFIRRTTVKKGDVLIETDGGLHRSPEDATESTTVSFVNREAMSKVVLSWVDYRGVPIQVAILAPGEEVTVATTVRHVFILSGEHDGKVLYEATIGSTSGVIGTTGPEENKDNALVVRVRNDSEEGVAFLWLDNDGVEHMMEQVAPGTTTTMTTYQSHRFVFRTNDGNVVRQCVIHPSTDEIRPSSC